MLEGTRYGQDIPAYQIEENGKLGTRIYKLQ